MSIFDGIVPKATAVTTVQRPATAGSQTAPSAIRLPRDAYAEATWVMDTGYVRPQGAAKKIRSKVCFPGIATPTKDYGWVISNDATGFRHWCNAALIKSTQVQQLQWLYLEQYRKAPSLDAQRKLLPETMQFHKNFRHLGPGQEVVL